VTTTLTSSLFRANKSLSFDKQSQQHIEPRSVEAMTKTLTRGQPADHEVMFDILRDVCGLPRPDDLPPSQEKIVVPPTTWIFSAALDGCIAADRQDMVVHYAQSVMNTRELHPTLLARHLHKLILAHHVLLGKEKGAPSSPSRAQNAVMWVEWMVAQDRHPREKTTPNGYTLISALDLCYSAKTRPRRSE
jgi:hypothetical protein